MPVFMRFMMLPLVLVAVPCSAANVARRPNVVLILADDQGSVDVNCYGADDLITPHLDALAARGIRFTQFYAAAPVCSPSRAALLTGRVPQRAGVPGNVSSKPGRPGMPAEQVTIAEMMRDAGYVTGHVGKWHLGYTPETMPNSQGFDESFGHMGGCIDNYSHFFYWSGPNRHDLWHNGHEIHRDGKFFPDLMVEQCKRFLDQNEKRPLFLYWAINIPHYPLQGTDAWRKRYRELPKSRRRYAAFVSTMDERIGQVVSHIDRLGLRDDTIIVFQSDHGHSTEERTFGGGGSSGIYRGAKFSLFEGGIRVPAIVSAPGRVPEGEIRGQLATGCDWLPTIAEMCDVRLPDRRLDGKSLGAVLVSANASGPHSEFHWRSGNQWAVRSGKWKLLGNPRDTSESARAPALAESDKRFLVDLDRDPGEVQNLAAQHPKVVRELESLHNAWADDLANRGKN